MRPTVRARSISVALVLTTVLATTSACQPLGDLGLPTWPDNPDWQALVPGPPGDDVKPVAVVRTHGSVTHAEALTGAAGGPTVLTVPPGGPSAIVVLDYGKEVGGTPYLAVSASSPTTNTVRVSTSEALTFLNTNKTTTLARAASGGDPSVKVTSVAPFYVGSPVTIDTGTGSETRTVTAVGSAAATNTSLAVAAAAGDTNISVGSVAGYTVGAPLAIDTGAGAETTTISAVGTAAGTPTTVVYPAAAGATNVKVASVAGFAAGQRLALDTGAGIEVRTASSVGTAATTSRLFGATVVGDTTIKLTSVTGLSVGGEVDVDPGPNQEHVTVTSVGTAGTNSSVAAQNTTSGLPVPALTGANWIWNVAGANTNTPAGTIYVRKTFTVADPSAIANAVLRVNADDGHTTYVNGVQVSASAGANNAWQTSQITDIRPLLVPGPNVIAIAPFNGGSAGSVLAVAQLDSTRIVTDGTWTALPGTPASPPAGWNTVGFDDSSWVPANVTGAYGIAPWNQNVGEPAGPTTLRVASVAGFAAGDTVAIDTGANQETRVIQSVGTAGATGSGLTLTTPLAVVHPAGVSVLDVSQPGTGITVTPVLTKPHDALATLASPGTGITFAPELGLAHAAGTTIRGAGSGISFTPALGGSHPVGAAVASAGTGITFSPALTNAHPAGATVTGVGTYANDNGAQITFTVTGAQTYTGGLRGGFRFQSIELTTPGTLTLTGAGLNFKAYRAGPDRYEGYFISSDDQLNRMWYAGAYTAQLDMVPVGVAPCFAVPVIFDGAKRDRAIWSGDLMVTNPVALLSIGSNSVPYIKGSIDSIANLQGPSGRLTSAVGFRGCGAFDYANTYSAYSAIIAVQYYRYTADTAYITALLPKLEAATAYHATRLDANGLIVTNDPDYWQITQSGEVTEYNLAYYELLRDMIWLEGQVGTPAKVSEYTTKAAALKDAINTRLWNASAGLYQHTDSRPGVYPLDANMNAIRLGVAPVDQVPGILAYFKNAWQAHGSEISQPAPSMADPTGHTIEPLNNTWELMARFQSGDTANALDLMRRLWGLQVDPNSGYYTGTFWEFVGSNGLPSRGFDSLAHAWGAGPTQLLTESVLGASAVNPGYITWQVKPQAGNLSWAQGRVPTAGGALDVKWAQDAGSGKFHLQVSSPASAGGEVWVPLASATTSISAPLTTGATFLRRAGNYDVYQVGAGTFEFASGPVTFASLGALVTYFSNDPNVTAGLIAKLVAASAARNANARNNQLDAFVQQVNAQTGRALTPEEAQVLVTLAAALRS